VNRCKSLALLIKNLCEHNCQPFKAFLGSFVPLHPNVYLNSDDKDSLADMAICIDGATAS
jgi:hypothetical protein